MLRNTAPHIAEYRHPLARFSFRTVYADSTNKSRFLQKELGMVYSRDILGEPGSLNTTAPRLLEDEDGAQRDRTEREKEERTLDELRFVPGDYLLIAVILPKNVTVPTELSDFGGLNFREALSGQNRVIYEVRDDTIYIHVVTDTRRDLRTLLQKRLLRSR